MQANAPGTERKNVEGTGAETYGIAPEPDEPQHYEEMVFCRQRRHALLADHSDEELAAGFWLFAEEIGVGQHLPVPPCGLPGQHSCRNDEAMELIREASRYAVALAKGERRTLWNIHDRVARALREAREDGRQSVIDEITRAAIERGQESRERVDNAKVYFIQTASGEIKIGMAQDVAQRLAGLQTAHPVKLTLLAVADGGTEQERAYHRRFAAHRLHGEWFSPHPDLLAEIERLAA